VSRLIFDWMARLMRGSNGWQIETMITPPITPIKRFIAGKMSDDGAWPWNIAMTIATPACTPT